MKEILNFDGQEVTWKKEEGFLYIYIDETFRSAGSYFNWIGHKEGAGINKKIIEFGCKEYATIVIGIRNHEQAYFIDALDYREFCERNNSFYKIKDKNITLCVIQLSKLKNPPKSNLISYKQEKLV